MPRFSSCWNPPSSKKNSSILISQIDRGSMVNLINLTDHGNAVGLWQESEMGKNKSKGLPYLSWEQIDHSISGRLLVLYIFSLSINNNTFYVL